ncbi:type VI secretion system baseplate subunit TssG [Flaviaesturariibacter amylovorans]|uniref:Type VI secretion system baseplate subunit TssG n=1 Tax=Flaviaesturariibacter amylovorans TaxID=1084520 RepID=A0ABP8HRM8_9BACT
MPATTESIAHEFSKVPSDVRGEVYAAELIHAGLPQEQIYFKTVSSFHRATGRDIAAVYDDVKEDGDPQLVVELNREGLYDMLPEGIFHYNNEKRRVKTKEHVLDDIRISRRQEADARAFFGPFENEFLHRRLQLELKERSLDGAESLQGKRELFENLFGDSSLLNDQQLMSLLHLLPVVHKIRGDLVRMAYCLDLLIGYPVSLRKEFRRTAVRTAQVLPRLGRMQLGINAIAGDSVEIEEVHYIICISEIPGHELPDFFTGGKNRRLLDYLIPFLMPAAAAYRIDLEVSKKSRTKALSSDTEPIYLSINSYV